MDPKPSFQLRPTTESQTRNQLTILKINKATGNDNIPAAIHKILANHIARSISMLVNSCFTTGIFRSKWKIAKVTPISKGNTGSDRDSY